MGLRGNLGGEVAEEPLSYDEESMEEDAVERGVGGVGGEEAGRGAGEGGLKCCAEAGGEARGGSRG